VDAVPLDNSGENWLVGIELASHGNFWGLLDAPADWRNQVELPSSLTATHNQREPGAIRAPFRVPAYPVHLTDLSSAACYLETSNTFPVGSRIGVDFLGDKLQVRCFAVVRLVHPQSGMGLEFTPQASEQQGGLHLVIDLLIARGEAAQIKALVHVPRQLPEQVRNMDRSNNLGVEDSLLALILRPDSVNREQFLEELRRQRVHPRR